MIPDDVPITAFLKPSGQGMELLIRVPLMAMNEIPFPVRSNGYIDLDRAATMLPGVARNWIADSIDIYEGETRLAQPQVAEVRVAMPVDQSFASFDQAMRHLRQPQTPDLNTFWNQALIDVLLEYPIQSDRAAFSFRPHLAHLGARVTTKLRFLPPDGTVRSFEYLGDPANLRLDPSAAEVALQFFEWGFGGTIFNSDYLLIVLCLVLPLRRIRLAAPVACGFIGAGTLTLFASVAGFATDDLWFPPAIQLLMAITILIVAAQNMAGGVRPGRRALEALAFGLIFGFDFAFALAAKAQYGAIHAATASLAFGAGIIVSLFLVFAALPPILRGLFHFTRSERIETIVLSLLAAHAAWHWMTERWDRASKFGLHWPLMDLAFFAAAMRWMMILVIFGGVVWFVAGLFPKQDDAKDAAV